MINNKTMHRLYLLLIFWVNLYLIYWAPEKGEKIKFTTTVTLQKQLNKDFFW